MFLVLCVCVCVNLLIKSAIFCFFLFYFLEDKNNSSSSKQLVRCSTVPYKCSLVRRELSTSVKYVRPVRISTTPYDVAETIFEEDPNAPVCSSLPPLPPGTTPSTRSRVIAAASGGPTAAAANTNTSQSNNNSSVSKSAQQQQQQEAPIDLTKTQHASLQLPNNMGTISIVIESLKI